MASEVKRVVMERVVMEGQGTFVRVRRPAYWVYVGLIAFGLLHIGGILRGGFDHIASALWVPLVLNGAMAVLFVWILGKLDYLEREPAAVRAAAMLWGALVATSVAIIANNALISLLTKTYGVEFTAKWGAALAGPINEEWVKTIGVVILVLIVREHFQRSMDGLTYGAFVGLGFQIVENLLYAINNALSNPNSDVAGSVSITLLRILIAGPWSHPVYSGVAGLGIAFFATQTHRTLYTRFGVAAGCFTAAWALHFLWNSPLPAWLPKGLGFFAIYGKGALILVFFLIVYGMAARREWHWFTEIMAGEPAEVITPDELDAMRTLRTRRHARKKAAKDYGLYGKRIVRRLQRAQRVLGEALARCERAEGDPASAPDVLVARANVLSIRAELNAPAKKRINKKTRKQEAEK
ncbi:protease PrsW [Actinorhabdospora filicis]|uniref:Protease PrsW n=1 Tax=Actinorhabdospora filicis TaxID=1785913 RepID=A0A9W6SMX4_9ACTN|nr:PrsW family intramembrane metalloprotease [Actinorhabdospora filicis]GLZ79855.1 protease PrsW [Actinorhabdospora filicis]